MTQKSRFSKGVGGLPDSEIEKLKKLRQTISSQTRPSASKAASPQEGEPATDRQFCQKAKKIPQFDPHIPFLSMDRERLYASPSCVELARLAATAAFNAGSCFVLSWPTVIDHPSLAHVLATLSFYSIYKEQELRTLYWPAKTNAMNYLRWVCINAQWLRRVAVNAADIREQKRSTTTGNGDFRDKTKALLQLNSLIDGHQTPLSLSEYISAYHYGKKGEWIRRPGVLMESVVKAVPRYRTKEMVRKYTTPMGQCGLAVDSLFCIHPEMDLGELKSCLQSPVFDRSKGCMPPNLVFLDLRAANRFQTEKWFQKAQHLFQHFQGKGGYAPTGMVVLVDSPLVYANLRRQYENWHFPGDIASERYQPKFTALVDTQGHSLEQRKPRVALPAKGKAAVGQQAIQRFLIQVTDRQTAMLVKRFMDLAKEVGSFSSRANKTLYDAAPTLSDISMLPGGMQALEAWLIEKLEECGWEPVYGMAQDVIWKKKAHALDDLMDEGELGSFYGTAKKLLNEADEYIQGIK
ncbi:MAG: hypothetical protein PF495_02595, partial [Spirochaetales bacterium]|nr:hypothetical protein [Spirochaetales bacterium]